MKLGQKVRFQKSLVDVYNRQQDIDKHETLKFAKENGMIIIQVDNGPYVDSKWEVKKHDTIQEGIICGVRTVDITGYLDSEWGGWIPGKRKKVYLVARNMVGFDRVPEEFIEEVCQHE